MGHNRKRTSSSGSSSEYKRSKLSCYKESDSYSRSDYWERRRLQRIRIETTSNSKFWVRSPEPDPLYFNIIHINDEKKGKKNKKNRKHSRSHVQKVSKKKSKKSNKKKHSSSSLDEEEQNFIESMKKKHEIKNTDEIIGPQIPEGLIPKLPSHMDFGKALLPGEGAAMAAYIADNKRIPRRGEIGVTSEDIDQFESLGYVMSGSRHNRMEAVRIRKENQIYSADEKRILAALNQTEMVKKEAENLEHFRRVLNKQLKKPN